MLTGSGGNLGLCVGEDATFLIDDQFAPLTEKIKEAIAKITPHPIKFVFNTHWHGDHTGGNENLGEMGALIVAHDNVRKRMSSEQFMKAFNRTVPASPKAALPVVTFNDTVTFHLNDEEIHALHVDPAHTDGDSVIFFKSSNVVHTGDLFFNGRYPFIDLSSGGSIQGMIAATNRLLDLIDEKTKIIPGHGELGSKADLAQYRDMLVAVKDRVEPLIKAGKSEEEVLAAKPLADLAAEWGEGFMNPDNFLKIVYASLKN
ncbi:MAG: MBL fold metallo-hydrolase [Acidobacteriota bacterium]|nr:MAG: MBL fold metallo-hydrolase [Acidobacteriota bacterium]